ncbi:MAG TPA: hypothetical protein VK815_00815 [Candidatus Acidoferrales bacterium]|nr:hypothetical protein [Candidatus Acidoferrales bacterium]
MKIKKHIRLWVMPSRQPKSGLPPQSQGAKSKQLHNLVKHVRNGFLAGIVVSCLSGGLGEAFAENFNLNRILEVVPAFSKISPQMLDVLKADFGERFGAGFLTFSHPSSKKSPEINQPIFSAVLGGEMGNNESRDNAAKSSQESPQHLRKKVHHYGVFFIFYIGGILIGSLIVRYNLKVYRDFCRLMDIVYKYAKKRKQKKGNQNSNA